ncbi:MAG: fasciclin domain-containing protein [Paludibacteraceae bacterium]|nr:fasciclin domain-containing protein [Paludibacteraceae bacterium]
MKKKSTNSKFRKYILWTGLWVISFFVVSCVDNEMQDTEPEWLGASIFDYLVTSGNFTNYVKLIEELDYKEVLSKTGSKTLFVATDSAFNEFYKNNTWGVTRYEELTLAQKKLILNFGMINDAYLVEMLSNYYNGGLAEGAAMRKQSAVSVVDSVPLVNGNELPETKYWDYYRDKQIYLLKDNTLRTIIFFTQKHLDQAQVTDDDFELVTGLSRKAKDAHVFGVKILKRDITCKNGYLNILESVLVPPSNMAEYVTSKNNMTLFSRLLERFSTPAYDQNNTLLYRQLNPDFSDSIFTKRYFAKEGPNGSYSGPPGKTVGAAMLLPFDPGWNSYARNAVGSALESDMAAMFVPNDAAMEKYFNSGAGAILKDRFKEWDSIPNEILPVLLKRHMRTSFIESVPSRFFKMVDVDNSPLPVKKEHIENVYIGSNGVVFETNEVYPPDDYSSVYSPVLLSANDVSPTRKTKIWDWAIAQNDFRLYLNSMVSRYSFFVPTDEYFQNYIDPVSFAQDSCAALKFWYNTRTNSVYATVYAYDRATNVVGSDSLAVITNVEFIKNRMLDMLNMNIVVDGVERGKSHYLTKGNVALKVKGSGEDMKIQGGANVMRNEEVNVTRAYNQLNGHTYFIDKLIQAPLQSVYSVLSKEESFRGFFDLLVGFPASSLSAIFVNKTNYFGIDFNVKFFNTFNYTVYVPTNQAVRSAIVKGEIVPWESLIESGDTIVKGINDLECLAEKNAAIENLERFLRYHFQDNSVFIDGQPLSYLYQSATMKKDEQPTHWGTFKNKFYRIGVAGSGDNLTLTTENNKKVNVDKSMGLYNIMTRDIVFNNRPSTFRNYDNSGSGATYISSRIYTSSTAVIHQVDDYLSYKTGLNPVRKK